MVTLRPLGTDWAALSGIGQAYRFCANVQYEACNWILPEEGAEVYCFACRHNRLVPDLSQTHNVQAWRKIEIAKHRLFYSLLRLELTNLNGLEFEFPADPVAVGNPTVMTGHENGRITIALAEADDAEREKRRTSLNEPYRELLGHFRHEIGHYFWDRLVSEGGRIQQFRSVFGDENRDYASALQAYYTHGAPADWQGNFVSGYATAHPWEDFAETWAHYLHIVDTLEMADAFGVGLNPRLDTGGELRAEINVDPYLAPDFSTIIDAWLPLTFALNSVNRCMGQPDLYPFILSPAVIHKLDFVHRLIRDGRRDSSD
jgi:hypothetical protein